MILCLVRGESHPSFLLTHGIERAGDRMLTNPVERPVCVGSSPLLSGDPSPLSQSELGWLPGHVDQQRRFPSELTHTHTQQLQSPGSTQLNDPTLYSHSYLISTSILNPPQHTYKRLRGDSESSPYSSHGPTGPIHFLSSTPSFPYSPSLHFCLVFLFFFDNKASQYEADSGKIEQLKAFLKTVTYLIVNFSVDYYSMFTVSHQW